MKRPAMCERQVNKEKRDTQKCYLHGGVGQLSMKATKIRNKRVDKGLCSNLWELMA